MASVYNRAWSGQDGKERVRRVAAYARSPELQRAIARLLDRSFQPRVVRRPDPRQLPLFGAVVELPGRETLPAPTRGAPVGGNGSGQSYSMPCNKNDYR